MLKCRKTNDWKITYKVTSPFKLYWKENIKNLDGARRGTSLVTPSAGCEEQATSFPSVETEVIEPEGGRKRHTGVASNAETYTTQTQDFVPTTSEVVKLTGLL